MSAHLTNSASPGTEASPSRFATFLKLLKDAKELIGIATIFGAGVVWIANYFATREQLESLECFTRINVRMLQANAATTASQQVLRQTRLEFREQSRFLARATQEGSGYSKDDIRSTEAKVEELGMQATALERVLEGEKKVSQRALAALTQNQCLIREQRSKVVSLLGE